MQTLWLIAQVLYAQSLSGDSVTAQMLRLVFDRRQCSGVVHGF